MGILTLIVIVILSIGESIPEMRHDPTLVVDGERGSTKNVSDYNFKKGILLKNLKKYPVLYSIVYFVKND